jgi:hypothetical protein
MDLPVFVRLEGDRVNLQHAISKIETLLDDLT